VKIWAKVKWHVAHPVCVTDCGRPRLRQELHGFTYLIEVLDLTLRCAEEAQRQLNDQEVDLCCEVLKILFNVTVGMESTTLDEVRCKIFFGYIV